MTKQEITLLKSYLVNEDLRIAQEISDLKSKLRYRKIDVTDCIELSLLLTRYEDFKHFEMIISRLLKL